MDLHTKVKDYIENASGFDEALALEIIEFQRANIPVYDSFLRANGISRINKIREIPFFPADFFKRYEIITGVPSEYFESSGTSGQQSRVFYHESSLELYKCASLKSFPFRIELIYSMIPDFSIAKKSSLSFMLKIFETEYKVVYVNDSYEIVDFLSLVDKLSGMKSGSLLFLTSSQLLRLSEYFREHGLSIDREILVVETGGYKALGKPYMRSELYDFARYAFPRAQFYSEYGMTELFSQFYSTCDGLYRNLNYAKVITSGDGLLRVFDFANLYTISALMVPDRVSVIGECFNVLGRMLEEAKGCAFTFR